MPQTKPKFDFRSDLFFQSILHAPAGPDRDKEIRENEEEDMAIVLMYSGRVVDEKQERDEREMESPARSFESERDEKV